MKELILVLLVTLISFGSIAIHAQCLAYFDSVPDPTHRYPGGWEAGNPDSVLLDTCHSSATYGELYLTKWIAIEFQYHILSTPPGPADTIIEVGWQAIDTNYTATRSAFAAIEAKYGSFILRKDNPDFTDTTHSPTNDFHLRFDNYVCIDSVVDDLRAIPLMADVQLDDGVIGNVVGSVVEKVYDTVAFTVYPNPSRGIIQIVSNGELPLRLLDDRGSCIRTWRLMSQYLDLSDLPSGTYYLVSPATTVKFIIEK